MATPNLGLYQIAVTNPDYEGGESPIAHVSASLAMLDAQKGVQVAGASGAVSIKEGTLVITKSSAAAAMTLVEPTVGLPSAGGDNGKVLRVLCTTTQAHTITLKTAAGEASTTGVNGASAVITFAAALDVCELVAYNGSWYVLYSTPTNVVIS